MNTGESVKSATRKPAPGLRARRHQDTRMEIARAALELFELQGTSATTVDQIARRAGVSPSTFFRSFATKEDSVLSIEVEFEVEIVEWLESAAVGEVTLSSMQGMYGRVIEGLVASPDRRNRLLRVRRLVATDSHMCPAAFAAESIALVQLTDKVAAKLGGDSARPFARLLVESVAMTRRIAVDTWAERQGAGEDADLTQIYANTCEALRLAVRS